MTNSVQQQREVLGGRLRELRLAAGLSGTELARRAGWHQTRVPKIEYGKTKPTEADIRLWCALTEAKDHEADLIATSRNIEDAYLEWRRVLHAGTRRRQNLSLKLTEESKILRVYQPSLIPGILQTAEYAQAMLRRSIEFHRISDDLDAGVAKRMERQQFLYKGDRRFRILIGEQALYTTVGNDSVVVGQLDRLLAVMSLARVWFGIIPAVAELPMQTTNFVVFDDRMVMVEGMTAELRITQPQEIALYRRVFDTLAGESVTGEAARELIRAALERRRPGSAS
ncbi:helix-turn-helix domain-containing protein [Nocardia carnea]|uniref:helix-turn-helix domain-containing protein n=1 Tax=Nocardia carnea TaxID=37328 RepID=UPI0024572238|nr:helix-turn-helix transcriptional regulator [Nocardia carnea]